MPSSEKTDVTATGSESGGTVALFSSSAPPTTNSAPLTISKHPEYYFADIVFLVSDLQSDYEITDQ
jgi:hypothetical protein